ncbi:MAG: helix-turn-helix domain-containing protein [Bacteroidetes bacterium]|nr:helix-turn-helix domain-containing protein [Bacteroidota bacterium]
MELYLKCWTQEQIADELKITQQTVSNIIENFTKNSANGKIGKTFEPFIYNKGIYSRL